MLNSLLNSKPQVLKHKPSFVVVSEVKQPRCYLCLKGVTLSLCYAQRQPIIKTWNLEFIGMSSEYPIPNVFGMGMKDDNIIVFTLPRRYPVPKAFGTAGELHFDFGILDLEFAFLVNLSFAVTIARFTCRVAVPPGTFRASTLC